MANEEDEQNQEDLFSDLEASITDSFSRLQESVDRHAERMSEIQNSAGDTLLSSDFMNSLNDKLEQISENNDQILEQQEALKSEFEQLNANISSLNTSVSELEQSLSSFTLEADINAEVDSSELSFLTESFNQSADRISRSISSEILSLSEDLTRAYSNLQEGASITPNLLLQMSNSITGSIDEAARSLSSEILSLSEDLTRAYSNLQEGASITPNLLLQVSNSITRSINEATQSLSSEILSLSEDLTKASDSLQTGTSVTPSLLLDISDSITETITTSIQENINTLRSDYSTGIELLELTLEENLEDYDIPSAVGQSLSNIESHIRQLVDAVDEMREGLLGGLSSLRENISSIEVSGGGEINYNSVREAVSTGFIEAFQQVQMQQFAQAGRGGQMRNRPNEPQQQTTVQSPSPLPNANFGNVTIPSFAGRQGPPQISRLLTGEASLNEEFPEFLSDLEAKNESLSNTIRVTNNDFEKFEDIISKVKRTGEGLQEINLGDALGENLVKGTEEYDMVIDELFNKFTDVIGARGEELVATTRNIIQESQEQLRYEEVMPDNFVGLVSRDLGYERVFQSLDEMAQRIEDSFINASANINELHEDQEIVQRMNQQIAGSADQMLEVYSELEQQGASVTEIQRALQSVTEQIEEETSEMREESQKFASTQDEVLSNLKQQITSVEKVKQRREGINEVYQRYFGMLQTVQNRYEDMQTLISGIGEALSSPKMWGFAALNGALALGYKLYDQILEIDNAMRGLADSTGLIGRGLEDARDITFELAGPLMARGATLQEVAETVATIRSELQGGLITSQRLNMTEQELAQTVGQVATAFNVSNQAAGQVLSSLQAITGLTGDSLENVLGMTQSLASQRDVAPQAVFEDIKNATEQIAVFGEVSAENIAEAAVSARELGTNLNEVLGIAENFRNDIVGSIQSLQQAELMLGQPIAAEQLVSTSFEDPEAFTTQLRSTLADLNLDLEGPLATFRLQSLSDAFGMSVGRLRQMAESARQAEMAIENVPSGEKFGALNQNLRASQSSFEEVTNRVTGLGQTLLNMLAQPILNTVGLALDSAAELLDNIITRLTAGGEITETFGQAIGVVEEEIGSFKQTGGETEVRVASFADTLLSFGRTAIDVGKAAFDIMKDLAVAFRQMQPAVEAAADTIRFFAEGSLGETIGKIALAVGAFQGLKFAVTSLAAPMLNGVSLLSTTTSSMATASAGASTAASAFGSFGAQALMVAGAVYTVSEAFENFAALSWTELAKGVGGLAVSLGGLTLAMRVMSSGLSSVNWPVMAAAGGTMLAFAGAVWVLSDAMGTFADAGMEGFEVMAWSLGTITAFGAGLASLIGGTAGIGAGAGLAAAGVLGAFGLALKLVGSAILDFAESAQMIGDALETINQLEDVGELAGKVRELGNALATMPDISISNIFAGMIGEGVADQLEMLADLGRQAQPLDEVATSVNRIADALERLEGVEVSGTLSQIDDLTSTSFSEGAGNFLTGIGSAISEMFSIDTEPQPTTQTKMGQQETVNTQTGQAQTPTVDPYQNLNEEQLGTEDQSYTNQMLENEEQMINLLQQIAESENALLSALRNGEVAVYMDGDDVTDTVFKKANQRNSRR